jgi:hypothetical protein
MYFPLIFHEKLNGFLNLVYLPPNSWENKIKAKINVYAIFSNGLEWNTIELPQLEYGQSARYEENNFSRYSVKSNLLIFYPTFEKLPKTLKTLPSKKYWHSSTPAWRNSTGFQNEYAQVSYQAEMEPFPPKASLLTFHPFIQYSNMNNNLIIINITKEPSIVEHQVKVYNSRTFDYIDSVGVKSNSATEIPLDRYNFDSSDLPVFTCDTMAAIPFGLGISKDNFTLSLEHTHPPASLVIFGDRQTAQSKIKQKWFKKLGSKN